MDRDEELELMYDEMLECMVEDVFEVLEKAECPHCVIKQALAEAFNEGLREGSLGSLENLGEIVEILKDRIIESDEE